MPFSAIKETFRGASSVLGLSLKTLKTHPQILIYPYLALLFILATSSLVGRVVINLWHKIDQPEVIGQISEVAPPALAGRLGLVTFAVFYTFFVTSFFTCMIAASTLAKLEDRPTSLFYGLKVVAKRFLRVTKFALLAFFFFPLGIIAQREKFIAPKGLLQAITRSFSLNMAQLAPAIVTGKRGVTETIRHSVETLGHSWKESLLIRIGTFSAILLLASLSFLPKLIESLWFDDSSAYIAGWIVTALLGVSSYVFIRVLGTVLTTTLYFEAKNKK